MNRLTTLFNPPSTPLQILSDLHLDHQNQYPTFHIPASAPTLLLAGNIGRLIDYPLYLSFLARRCAVHDKVFLVLGALEFSGLEYTDALQLAHGLEGEPATRGRLEVLYRTRAELGRPGSAAGIVLLGATLWSAIPAADESAVVRKCAEFAAESGVAEWSVQRHNREHERDVRWLKRQLGKAAAPRVGDGGGRVSPLPQPLVVVVTAFAPDRREALEPWQVDAPWSSAYGTDLLSGEEWAGVKLWVCGTTGRTCEFKKGGTTVVSNQRGREGEHVTGLLKDGLSEKQKAGLFDVMRVARV
ncbi:uncharacterized protein EKO05_0010897 [Ascochyta rabiei]|uniref:Uncharacterized protein n=1 Tax=Didymella rabiei TaxID=5454 RepID=A0A162ZJA2_DIDRA|nr:uncharacterized protein EKO05_0010897 [Ascochyta rabiei]KZM20633.1 hypothetical protein ST47_g8222 [Ascochyta rabiei]UPX20672.1 hypothetical protein EKO05_0010897 [Ascochyta rabiei]